MVAYLVGIELRRRWRSLALLALLVAVVVGTVLASVAGARRSSSAYDRYVEGVNAPDLIGFGDPETLAGLDELPMVEAALPFEIPAAFPAENDDYYPMAISLDGRIPTEYFRHRVVEGRLADPSVPLEVVLSERTADRLAVGPGDQLPMQSLTPAGWEAFDSGGGGDFQSDGPEFALDVVGIVRESGDLGGRSSDLSLTFLSPAFRDQFDADEVASTGEGTFVALVPGADVAELSSAAQGDVEFDTSLSTDVARRQTNPTMRAIATALYVFAGVVALAGLATVAHAAALMQRASAADDRTLAALGIGRAARWSRLALPGFAAVLVGTPAGLAAAIAGSRWFPVGLAARAEPNPGVDIDGSTLAVGTTVALLLGLLLVGALGARTAGTSRNRALTPRLSAAGRVAAGAGAPPPVVSGLAFAARAGSSTGSAGRAAVGGTMLGVLGIVAALMFATSVDRLVIDPQLYGWGWDANIAGGDRSDLPEGAVEGAELVADDDLAAVALVVFKVGATIDGIPEFLMVASDRKGHIAPIVVQGAEPRTAEEIALGRDSLEGLGKHVGDHVTVDLGGEPGQLRITGVVALPVPQDGGSSASGAYLTGEAAKRLGFSGACGGDSSCYRNSVVRLRPGVDVAGIVARYEAPESDAVVDLPTPPGEIERLTAVKQLPWYLAGFLALLAGVAVTYAVASTTRDRRRDLAMLRVLGMTARQLRSVIAVQVLALTLGGTLVGTILGVIAGRQIWRLVVDSVSLPFAPRVPLAALILIPFATLLVTQLAATFSRRAAGRAKVAFALRAE